MTPDALVTSAGASREHLTLSQMLLEQHSAPAVTEYHDDPRPDSDGAHRIGLILRGMDLAPVAAKGLRRSRSDGFRGGAVGEWGYVLVMSARNGP